MNFSKITYKPLNGPLAQVDRRTFELFIDGEKWAKIGALPNGALYRDFILLHEDAHITLQESSEYRVNRHAINKFLKPIGQLTNEELGARIVVLSDLLENDFQNNVLNKSTISNFEGVDPYSAIANGLSGLVTSIFNNLPAMGVGSKSRQREAENQAKLTMQIETERSRASQKLVVISGVILLLLISIFLIFKK